MPWHRIWWAGQVVAAFPQALSAENPSAPTTAAPLARIASRLDTPFASRRAIMSSAPPPVDCGISATCLPTYSSRRGSQGIRASSGAARAMGTAPAGSRSHHSSCRRGRRQPSGHSCSSPDWAGTGRRRYRWRHSSQECSTRPSSRPDRCRRRCRTCRSSWSWSRRCRCQRSSPDPIRTEPRSCHSCWSWSTASRSRSPGCRRSRPSLASRCSGTPRRCSGMPTRSCPGMGGRRCRSCRNRCSYSNNCRCSRSLPARSCSRRRCQSRPRRGRRHGRRRRSCHGRYSGSHMSQCTSSGPVNRRAGMSRRRSSGRSDRHDRTGCSCGHRSEDPRTRRCNWSRRWRRR